MLLRPAFQHAVTLAHVRRRCRSVLSVLAVVAAVIAGGCDASTVVTSSPTQVKCQVSLAAPSILDAVGGPATVTITTQPECGWDVSTPATWITGLSPTSGQGNGQVAFQVAPNQGASTREGDIVVNGQNVRVSQPAPCRFQVGPASQNIQAGGGAGSVTVTATGGCSWTATTDVSWISLAAPVSGSGNGTVTFDVAANGGNGRTGTVMVADQTSTVTQAGVTSPGTPPACTHTIAPTSQNVAAAGSVGTVVTVSSGTGCSWTASSNAAWITITAGLTGSGNGSVTFDVAANTGAPRNGTLTIAGQTFSVTQAAAASTTCTYSIAPTSQSIAATGSVGTVVTVSTGTGCPWTAGSNAAWITVTSGSSGSGNGSVTFDVAANTGAAQSGTLTIAGQTFSVMQAAAASTCSYTITPTSQTVGAAGSVGTVVTVSTGTGCPWTASSNDAWITVTAGLTGSGNGSVTFDVAANTGASRNGTLTIAGQTFSVTQAAVAATCTYSIAPTKQNAPGRSSVGTVSVSTASGCTWTAASNDAWITITSGASGTGSGTVQFDIQANPSKKKRSGSLTIAGRTAHVDQQGR